MKNTKVQNKCDFCKGELFVDNFYFQNTMGLNMCSKCADTTLYGHEFIEHDEYPFIYEGEFEGQKEYGSPFKTIWIKDSE